MTMRTIRNLRVAFLLVAAGGCTLPAHAGDSPPSVGAVYGYGDGTNIYGVQAAWSPPLPDDFLARHDLDLRLSAEIARWVARADAAQYGSLTDGSVIAELRYSPLRDAPVQPFVELGFGLHLLSHVHIAEQDMTTAFNFGSQGAVGFAFGEHGRYEVAALIHHVSNGGIKHPNDGLTYGGIRFRIALP
jgi:lipid A 3-O-deacylase